jgi:hypothetical protein
MLPVCTLLFMIACKSNKTKTAETTAPESASIAKSKHSDVFNISFKAALDQYYALKDAFIAEKDGAIDSAATKLIPLLDSIQLGEAGVDSNTLVAAKQSIAGLKAELKGLLGENKRDEKRKAFEMLGEQLYLLIRTIQYDNEVVYHQFCPMAFNDKGATWLSNSSDIRNPYLPKTMLHCGEVKDSIDLRTKL